MIEILLFFSIIQLSLFGSCDCDLSKVSNLTHEFSAKRVDMLFLDRPLEQIAPKSEGGYYMAYSNKKEKDILYLVEFDSDDATTVNKSSKIETQALDIIETDFGFVLYIRYSSDINHASFISYDKD